MAKHWGPTDPQLQHLQDPISIRPEIYATRARPFGFIAGRMDKVMPNLPRSLFCAFFFISCAKGSGLGHDGALTTLTNASITTATNPQNPTTGAHASSEDDGGMGSTPPIPTTGPSIPTTGSNVTGNFAEGPDLSTGGMEVSSSEGNPAETTSTTGSEETSSGEMETTSGTTGNMGPNDPQPDSGLYEHCLSNRICDLPVTDGCFIVYNEEQMPQDGYCTVLCNDVVACGPQPNVPATQVCVFATPNQKICALLCTKTEDCPGGMSCVANIFFGDPSSYCL